MNNNELRLAVDTFKSYENQTLFLAQPPVLTFWEQATWN